MYDDTAASELVHDLFVQWLDALANHDLGWPEQNLAADFVMTAHPFEKFYINKQEFIDLDRKMSSSKLHVVKVAARQLGDVILSHTIMLIQEETLSSEPGHDLPSAAELGELMSGKTHVFASAWRKEADIWKCFDHHLIGPIAYPTSHEAG